MCFALPWNCGFFAIAMDDWLSSRMTVGPLDGFLRSELSLRIHTHSCAALDSATYSASAVDRATVSCFLLLHDTGPHATWNKYPEVDFLSSLSPAQSASE